MGPGATGHRVVAVRRRVPCFSARSSLAFFVTGRFGLRPYGGLRDSTSAFWAEGCFRSVGLWGPRSPARGLWWSDCKDCMRSSWPRVGLLGRLLLPAVSIPLLWFVREPLLLSGAYRLGVVVGHCLLLHPSCGSRGIPVAVGPLASGHLLHLTLLPVANTHCRHPSPSLAARWRASKSSTLERGFPSLTFVSLSSSSRCVGGRR